MAVAALACCLAALTAVLLVQLRGEFGAIGTAPSQSDGAFTAYDAALSSVIAINSTAFTSAVAGGEADAGTGSLAFAVLAGLLVAALTCAGVRPRLAEYR